MYGKIITILFITLFSHLSIANRVDDVETYMKNTESQTIYGPATVQIRDTATIDLIYGQAFIPEEVAVGLFDILGNKIDGLAGIILPGIPGEEEPDDNWGFIAIEIVDNGHISDDDANNIDLSGILDNIKENIKPEANTTVLDWISKPIYESNTHVFSWSYSYVKSPDSYFDMHQAYVLGRTGLIGFTYISDSEERTLREPLVSNMIQSIKYNDGSRYEDYIEGSDKLSSLGLAGLVAGGVVAKKLGLLAIALGFIAKFGKLIFLVITPILIFLKLKKKKSLN